MESLHFDMLFEISKQLDIYAIIQLCSLNKKFTSVSNATMWTFLLKRDHNKYINSNLYPTNINFNNLTCIEKYKFFHTLNNVINRSCYYCNNYIKLIDVSLLFSLNDMIIYSDMILPRGIYYLTNLTRLDIKLLPVRFEINEIVEFLEKNHTYKIKLYEAEYFIVSKEIGSLQNLLSFVANGNNIKSIPDEFYHLTRLENLELADNKLTSFIDCNNFANLFKLDMEKNNISIIPNSISMLTNLEYLYLGDNQIKYFPKELCALVKLKALYLNANLIIDIPKEIGNLKLLRTLNLSNNHIQILPIEICLIGNDYEKAYLGITHLHKWLQLYCIKSILLNNNLIKNIENNICNLHQADLSIIMNVDKHVKTSLYKTNIIDLSDNYLKAIPEGISNFNMLKSIELMNNPIEFIHSDIINNPKIKLL